MTKKTKPAGATEDTRLDGFAQQVEIALEHFTDPDWLGENSILAKPYVLGQFIEEQKIGDTVQDRGNALRAAIHRSLMGLDRELATVLKDIYIERNPNLTNAAMAMKHNMSERTFYRWRQQAIQSLADDIYVSLLPPLRIEQPQLRPMVGRTNLLNWCMDKLTAGLSVYLSGQSGAGKTVIGARLYSDWPTPGLWYTVRPGLSDRLSNFVFVLAYFLRSLGAIHTWRQLLADKGMLQPEKVLGTLRYDLQRFQDRPLLLCVDEVDLLSPDRSDHAQLLHLIDELRNHVRIVLIGQRTVMETDVHFAVKGFDFSEFTAWLALVGAPQLDESDQRRLYSVTNGQPALLSLASTLFTYSADVATALAVLPDTLSLEVLLVRVWRKLDDASRQMLMEISVFTNSAPMDFFETHHHVLRQLIERGLVHEDHQGGVECDPHIRGLVYERVPMDFRSALHLRAAVALEQRGEFVHAMHQYLSARQPAQAVWLWFAHRARQIERGQGPAALLLLEQIVAADLPEDRDRAALALSRAELYKLVGQPEAITQTLGNLPAQKSGAHTAYAQQLLGDAFDLQGDIERSLAAYRTALETLAGSESLRQVMVHQRIVYLHLTRIPDLATAKQEAKRALFQAETFAADVEMYQDNLETARDQYMRAIRVAESAENNAGLLAVGYSHLGMVQLKMGDLDAAIESMERGRQLSEARGDLVGPLYDRFNLSFIFALKDRYDEALNIAVEGLPVAERMQHAYCIAGLTAAAGDAAFYKGDLDAAEQYAIRSLMQEEIFFRAWALRVLGSVQARRGHYTEAVKTLKLAIEAAREREDEYTEAYAKCALGETYMLSGQRDLAKSAFYEALSTYDRLGYRFESQRLRTRITELGLDVW